MTKDKLIDTECIESLKVFQKKNCLQYIDSMIESKKFDDLTSLKIAEHLSLDHEAAIGLLKSLEVTGKIKLECCTHNFFIPTEESKYILEHGSPEFNLISILNNETTKPVDFFKKDVFLKNGLTECLRNGWISINESQNVVKTTKCINFDRALENLKECLQNFESEYSTQLLKRKWLKKMKSTFFLVKPTEMFSVHLKEYVSDINSDMIKSGSWVNVELKPYNFKCMGLPPENGSIHPLNSTIEDFKIILVEMGFEEMDTSDWVTSSFWNFDALFQPQSHPCRDAHDTFYLQKPDLINELCDIQIRENEQNSTDNCYINETQKMHESGDNESLGWGYKWNRFEAKKLLLRTHTTAVTSRLLRKIGKMYQENNNINLERKFFSIDRVFRNETLDATHLAEFHQVEGIFMSRNASLKTLMGIIKVFFERIGIQHIKFKPAYNPYTEPSMEIFGYHPKLKKWTEIGNSGVFRDEMIKPMGLPDDLVVLGWGLSTERPTMISNEISDIRQLFGPKSKITVI